MTEESRRHVRLRLARRHTAPTRVRARAREEPPAPQSDPEASSVRRAWSWLRRRRWSHIVTVTATGLAAIAAIGGLWAQAVATNLSQQTAKDQLNQSKDDAAEKQRAQAQAVSYWKEEGNNGEWSIHIQNRSLDPVPWFILTAEAKMRRQHSASEDGPNVVLHIETSGLAPCTELIYARRLFNSRLNYVAKISGSPNLEWGSITSIPQARFADNDGRIWMRTAKSLKAYPTVTSIPKPSTRSKANWWGTPAGAPAEKAAASCGRPAG